MARPPRRAAATSAGGKRRASNPFDALAKLRAEAKPALRSVEPRRAISPPTLSLPSPPAPQGKAADEPTPRPCDADAAAADDPGLFREAVRDVTPLPDDGRRAEIDTPKPSPLPRRRVVEADGQKSAAHGEPGSLDDFALFRSTVGDVTPLRRHERAQFDPLRPAASPRHVGAGERDGTDRDVPPPLPSEADATDPAALFRHAIRGARPIDTGNRVELEAPPPLPEPLKHGEDERAVLRESLDAPMSFEDHLETGDEAAFLRPGLPRRVLTDLRRGRWVLQGEVDLHGCNRDEARDALARFLASSLQQGRRCVRVIHGKGLGSPGRVSILKQLSRGWLAQREEILAFCQAGPHEGGSGALLVLLRAGNPPKA